jgi:tight adherence protein C
MGSDALLYLGLLMAGFAVYLLANSIFGAQADSEALSWATGDEVVKSKSGFINASRPLVHRFALGLAAKIKSQSYRRNVKKKILRGGMSRELNVDEFIGMQILWGAVFPVFLLFLNFTLELGYPPVIVVILGAIGCLLPHMHAAGQQKRRQQSITADLPFFIDLFALSTEAGLEFVTAIRRIIDKAEDSVLAEELGKVLEDITVGGDRSKAFKDFADRLDIPEITSFVVVINDAEAQGQSVSKVLKQQSIQMRLERFTRAEKAGAQASQLILVPLMLFIIPAVLITVFGPVVLQFMSGGGP